MRPSAHIEVSFSSVDETEGLSLELDSEKNKEVYSEDKSDFFLGEAVYLKLVYTPIYDESGNEIPYSLHTSAGTVSTNATNILYSQAENLIFEQEKQMELQNVPSNSVDWKWMGKSGGSPLFNGRSVSISEESTRILYCSYTYRGNRLRLIVPSSAISNISDFPEISAVVVAERGDQKASLTVSFAAESLAPIPMELKVSDFCSNEEIVDVDVFIDGSFIGKTNINGRVYLGMMKPKTHHSLKMTKTGYIDSDKDVLYNDYFTVPAPSE